MPFTLQFLGVGGAFAMPTVPGDLTTCAMQSNMVITAASGKRMLFDCGTDIRLSAQMCGYGPGSFDAVYISHEHADHAGGLEWLLLNRLFMNLPKVQLVTTELIAHRLWQMLEPGLGLTTRGRMRFEDYVELCINVPEWEELRLYMVQQYHVKTATDTMVSYGLQVTDGKRCIFISSDTIFSEDGDLLKMMAPVVDLIFHDCEVGFKTGVHAHYAELLTLPPDVRARMWLYHYNPAEAAKKDACADGFCGFVQRGQVFTFE